MVQYSSQLYDQAFMLTQSNFDPKDIDFRFYGICKIIKDKSTGLIKEKLYFARYDPDLKEYVDLAVRVAVGYDLDVDGVTVLGEKEYIEWFLLDGSVGTTRTVYKFYEFA